MPRTARNLTKVTVRLSRAMADRATTYGRATGRTRAGVVRYAISQALALDAAEPLTPVDAGPSDRSVHQPVDMDPAMADQARDAARAEDMPVSAWCRAALSHLLASVGA